MQNISFNKYLPLALLYLFFNGVALPEGLLYTTFLTPFFFYSIAQRKLFAPFIVFCLVFLFYGIIQFYLGVDAFYYLRSWALMFCNFTFCIIAYLFIKECKQPEPVFKSLVLTNGFLVIVAMVCLYIPLLKSWFWYMVPVSPGIAPFPRLKLFASEASVYSLYITPLFLYYLFKSIKYGLKLYGFALLILLVSYVLSFSLGVILSLFITLLVVGFYTGKEFFSNRNFNQWLLFACVASLAIAIGFYLLKPDNVLFQRMANILTGADTSTRGRTYEAFILAFKIIKEKSYWFGIGPGQIKLIGKPVILQYYQYLNIPETVRIPNACSETLIYFGVVGLVFRIGLELFLFFKCRVYTNSLRLAIFIFIFIYQFTGSYITNIAEYVLWIIAFTKCFPEFDQRKEVQTE